VTNYDIAVNGAGLAGLTAALALSKTGKSIALIAPPFKSKSGDAVNDGRTTALLAHSLDFLEQLDVWDKAAEFASPLKVMRIVDATKRLIRAPQVEFRSAEIDLLKFGENIENSILSSIMFNILGQSANVTLHETSSKTISFSEKDVQIELADGDCLSAQFLVAADGRNSPARNAAGIETRNWRYPQVAIVTNIDHTRHHENISTEFHCEAGPFVVVPLPGDASSIVWVETKEVSDQLKAMDRKELGDCIEQKMHSILGKVSVTSKVQTYPLSGMTARHLGKDRLALIGEAGHVIPPIGAQGFNLGIRDVETIVQLLESTPQKD